MLPPRPIGRDPAPPLPPPPDDRRLWELHERVTRLETDRKWLGAALLVLVLGAGVIGPLTGAWLSGQRADRYEAKVARLDEQVRGLDRDVDELLAAVVAMDEESVARTRELAASPEARAAVSPEPEPEPVPARVPAAPPPRPIAPARRRDAATWAEMFGEQIREGPLDAAERAEIREQWDGLNAVLQEEILTAMLRRYGIAPETFLTELEEPAVEIRP